VPTPDGGPPTTSLPLHDSQPPSGLSRPGGCAAWRDADAVGADATGADAACVDVAGAVGAAPTGAVSEACQATTAGQGDADTQARRECGKCLRVHESRNALMKHLRSEHWVAQSARGTGEGGKGAAARRASRVHVPLSSLSFEDEWQAPASCHS
jgi:hypothetical protein